MKDRVSDTVGRFVRLYPWVDADGIEISYRLSETSDAMRSASDRIFAMFGAEGGRPRYGIMRGIFFEPCGWLTQNQIAEQVAIPPSTVTYLVDGLERDKLVARTAHPTDRRVSRVALTDDGRALCERMLPAVSEHMSTVANVFTPEEKRQFISLLKRFQQSAEATNQKKTSSPEGVTPTKRPA